MRDYRLPDGTTTTDDVAYSRAWNELAKRFEDLLDARMYAYDPDLAFQSNTIPKHTFRIDADVALCLNNRLEFLEKRCMELVAQLAFSGVKA